MFIACLNARRVRTAILIIMSFALCGSIAAKGLSSAVGTKSRLLPIYCVKTGDKKLAITFDAAWDDSDTDELISILAEYDAKATFFIVGEWAQRCSESVVKLSNAGHEIANHSDTHADFATLDKANILNEVITCNDRLSALTGTTPSLLRAPSGSYNNDTIEAAQTLGMYTVQWSVDSLDYKGDSSQIIADRVLSKAVPGSIILFHNSVKNTPGALKAVLTELKSQGYMFVTVSDLIYKENYTINHAGMQISKRGQNGEVGESETGAP